MDWWLKAAFELAITVRQKAIRRRSLSGDPGCVAPSKYAFKRRSALRASADHHLSRFARGGGSTAGASAPEQQPGTFSARAAARRKRLPSYRASLARPNQSRKGLTSTATDRWPRSAAQSAVVP